MGWRRAGPAAETVLTCVRRRGWVGTLETPPADVVSLAVPESSRRVPTMARLGGRPLRLRTAKLGRGRVLLYSDKIDLGALGGDRVVEIPTRCPAGRQVRARVLGWTAERPG